MKNLWKEVEKEAPPIYKVVLTCIKDKDGIRNEQYLRYNGSIWWLPDESMYVYYTPTHWRNPE